MVWIVVMDIKNKTSSEYTSTWLKNWWQWFHLFIFYSNNNNYFFLFQIASLCMVTTPYQNFGCKKSKLNKLTKVLKELSYDSRSKWRNHDTIEIGWVGLGEFACDNTASWKTSIKKITMPNPIKIAKTKPDCWPDNLILIRITTKVKADVACILTEFILRDKLQYICHDMV